MSGQVEEIRLVGGGPELYARLRTSDQEAPTIVLLCGLGFHTFEYEPLAESLTASGYNVLSLDYRGHGRSDGPRGRWSLADLASDARRAVGLVSGRGFERIGVFGNSLGAMIAIQIATADPRVRGVVASNCPAHIADFLLTTPLRMLLTIARPLQMVPAVRISVGHFYSYEQLINDRAWVTRIRNDPTVTAARRLSIGTYRTLLDWDGPAAVHALHRPILVIQGRTDRLQPAEQSQILFDAANDPSEHQLVDAGHLPHLENTGLLAKRLVDWFDNTT